MLLCFCLSVLCAYTVISALPTAGEEMIYDRVIRLHVLANSDTAEDQALKLRVRDAILSFLANASIESDNADEAEACYMSLLPEITRVANETLAAADSADTCRVTLSRECYPPRQYDSVTLPAGTYRSLRVMIGDAVGQNWWCVLFPPLCLSLAVDSESYENHAVPAFVSDDTEEKLLAAGFTPYEVSLISQEHETEVKTVVKFRIVEWFRRLFSKD